MGKHILMINVTGTMGDQTFKNIAMQHILMMAMLPEQKSEMYIK